MLLGDNSLFEEEPSIRCSLALEYQVCKRLASNNRPYTWIDQNKSTGRCTLNNVVTNLLSPGELLRLAVLEVECAPSMLEPARFVSLLIQTARRILLSP